MALRGKIADHRKGGWKMTPYRIILIEDRKKDAEEIVDCLEELMKKRDDKKYNFRIEHIEGKKAEKYEEDEYLHYDESVMDEIEAKYLESSQKKEKMGLLLDVMLTKEDLESSLSSYYPQAELAKRIYFEFHDSMPVYMITASPVFAIQSDIIMGVDLSEQYIAKNALLRYKFENNIAKLFEFYQNFNFEENCEEGNYV